MAGFATALNIWFHYLHLSRWTIYNWVGLGIPLRFIAKPSLDRPLHKHQRWLQAAMKILIKTPKDCTPEELTKFNQLVLLGGQVEPNGLGDRILNCRLLGLCFINNDLVGVSAIKQPIETKTKRIKERAKVHNVTIPQFELGYSVTKEEFRGQKINSSLNDKLLEEIDKNETVYATTNNDAMRNFLTSRGFKRLGESFEGSFNIILDYYEKTLK